MNQSVTRRSAMAVTLALAIGSIGTASVAAPGHLEHTATIAALQLNAGKQWTTDTHLRNGMSRIRDAVFAELDAIHLRTMDAGRYEALARRIDGQIAYIIENCRLSPQADAQLHLVLTQIMQGSVAMQGRDPNYARRSGLEGVVSALEAYSRHFDHPGWKALAI